MGKCKFGSECLYLHERGGQIFNSAFESSTPSDLPSASPSVAVVDQDSNTSGTEDTDTPNPSPRGDAPDLLYTKEGLSGSSSSISTTASGLASIPQGQAVPSFKALETLRMIDVRKVGRKLKDPDEKEQQVDSPREPEIREEPERPFEFEHLRLP